MEIFSASEARANLFRLVEQVNIDHLPPGFLKSIRGAEQANGWVSEDEFLKALDGLED